MTNGKNHEITSYQVARKALEDLIANPGRPTILLSGEWGSGKTWLVQKQIFPKIETSRLCIHLSVAACQSLGDVKKQLEEAFLSAAASEGASTSAKISKALSSFSSLIPKESPNSANLLKAAGEGISRLLSQSVLNEAMKGSVICFDDLDRLKNQELIQEILFLGLEYKESWDCSVISILNISKVKQSSDAKEQEDKSSKKPTEEAQLRDFYKDIFEKTVDRQVRLPEIDKVSFSKLVKQACSKGLETKIWQDAFLKIALENHSQEPVLKNLRLIQRFVFYALEWEEYLEATLPKLSEELKDKFASLVTEIIFKQEREKWDDQFPKNVSPNEAAAREFFSGNSFPGKEPLSTEINQQFENGYLKQGEALEGLLSQLVDYWTAGTQTSECQGNVFEMWENFKFSLKEIVAAITANFKKYIPEKTNKGLMSLSNFSWQLNFLEITLSKSGTKEIDINYWEETYLKQIEKSSPEFIRETLRFSDIGAPNHSARHQLREAVRKILSEKNKEDEASLPPSERIGHLLSHWQPFKEIETFSFPSSGRSLTKHLDPAAYTQESLEPLKAIPTKDWIDYLYTLSLANLRQVWSKKIAPVCLHDSTRNKKDCEDFESITQEIKGSLIQPLTQKFKEIFTKLDKTYPERAYPIRCRKIYEDLGLLPEHDSKEGR